MAICSLISDVSTLADLLVWPTTCYYYFYLVVLITIFGVTAFSIYNAEKEKFIKADLTSTLGVSSIATFVLAMIMTLIKNTSGIPMLQRDLFLYIVAGTIVFVGIWIFKKN